MTELTATRLTPVPALSDNYIWVLSRNGAALVVDPGEAPPVLAYLQEHGLTLDAILLTHHHNDHVGGVQALRTAMGGTAPIYGPATEKLPACDHRLAEGDAFTRPALDVELTVLDVPGHTAGHIAYVAHLPGQPPLLFCGDTLFAAGCGRLFEGTSAQMVSSLGKLAALPGETLVCCAHEYTLSNLRWACAVDPDDATLAARHADAERHRAQGLPTLPTTLTMERDTNPFLRLHVPAIEAAAARHAQRPLAGEVDVFTALRTWKNDFR